MFTKEQLIGLALNGYFKKSQNEMLREDSDKLDDAEVEVYIRRRDQIEDTLTEKYRFDVRVLDYDSKSKIFIARGRDFFGDSGLVGTIYGNDITFTKIYAGEITLPEDVTRIPQIHYEGKIIQDERKLIFSGAYQPQDRSFQRTGHLTGIWRLETKLE
ncbi:MAG: hypothetical protein AABW52_01475 [Nanoarchaeota archaeon]